MIDQLVLKKNELKMSDWSLLENFYKYDINHIFMLVHWLNLKDALK